MKIQDVFIKQDTAILEAMKIIEESRARIALIVDADLKLIGTATDGDIRRGLIKNITTAEPVKMVMNSKPTILPIGTSVESIDKVFLQKKIAQIPLVNEQGVVVEIALSPTFKSNIKKENTVVLMAGGLGTRLGSLTENCPKPMLKVGDRPILEVVLENLKEHSFSNFVITVNYKAEMIESYFKNGSEFGVNIEYIHEKERMGTAGSLSLVKPKNDHPIIVMNGDVLTKFNFSQFLSHHIDHKYAATMCVRKYDLQVPFGVVEVDERSLITGIKEKPTHSFFVNAGIYAINPEVLSLIPQSSYFDMPDLFNVAIEEKSKKVGVFPIHEYWMDVGRHDDFNQAQVDYNRIFK